MNTLAYPVAAIRAAEQAAMQARGVSGLELMEQAGAAALAVLRDRWPAAGRIVVVCGLGNNAGDGYVLARLARAAGLDVRLQQVGDEARLRGDAQANACRWRESGGRVEAFGGVALQGADVVVDALFGIGLDRPLEGEWLQAVETINATRAPVLAVDVPSGLNADTGAAMGAAVNAACTVTFIGSKRGFYTADGPDHCGEIVLQALGVDLSPWAADAARLLDAGTLAGLPPRRRNTHKGTYGHVLVVGGNLGMAGAARMAAEAALRSGAGLVSVATHPDSVAQVAGGRPELMVHGIGTDDERAVLRLLGRADVVAVGPGLGLDRWSSLVWRASLNSGLPLVVDADALQKLGTYRREDWVLTPHPGEAQQMLHPDTVDVQADRFAVAECLQQRYGGIVVLKGAGTLVRDAGQTAICADGNPGMACGGMGDLLTGIIAAFMAQGLAPEKAARLGVWLHARAADRAAEAGQRGLLPMDVLPFLRQLLG